MNSVTSVNARQTAAAHHRSMTHDAADVLKRCERLLTLMGEAMELERSLEVSAEMADVRTRSMLRPILEDAFARLETLRVMPTQRSLNAWVTELISLELELDKVFSQRGWPVQHADPDGAPPTLNDRL